MSARFGFGEALFSVKSLFAAMLAYYIALRIGLTNPYWAVMTAYIVANPLAGAVLSKAVFRAVGTIVGAAAAVFLVPVLVNAPELLSLALALWLGLCVYFAALDRTPRAYVFLLAGYTACIVGFPAVSTPDAVFTIAVVRVQEILIGIGCSSLVHGVVFPQSMIAPLLRRVDGMVADAERWSCDSLAGERLAALELDRRRVVLDINDLHQISVHLPFDTAQLQPRVRTLHALQDQLSMVLPLASAVDDRLHELGRDAMPAAVADLVSDVRDWLRASPPADDRAASALQLVERAIALEPALASPLAWHDAVKLSLLVRLGDLVIAHRDVRDLRDQLHTRTRVPLTPAVARLIGDVGKRALHVDHGVALRAAVGVVATILIGCAFWITTGWSDGAGAVMFAGVCCGLFGIADDPVPMVFKFFIGSLFGLALATGYAFVILPRVTDFVTLVAVLAPMLLAVGTLLARAKTALVATGMLLTMLGSVGLGDRYVSSFSAFVNGGVAQVAGILLAATMVGLVQTIGAEGSTRRLIRAGWRDLARECRAAGPPDAAAWISRMLDRIGLLAPRLAAVQQDPGKTVLDTLVDLRVGVAVGELRQLRIDAGTADAAHVSPVLRGIGDHYAARDPDRSLPPQPALLVGIDRAMASFAIGTSPETRRRGVLALTSLRRNLFPAAKALAADGSAAAYAAQGKP